MASSTPKKQLALRARRFNVGDGVFMGLPKSSW
jgi:hypothetical protein